MSVVIFTGPSLSPDAASATLPGAIVRAPVACGDVYRAMRERPSVIALIDGYFDQRLAVWHKEILWALSSGVRVLGASSMGALRAAELGAFGMRGVGRIYEWFRDGLIEDDDEVALVHEPAERGYRPVSEPMVNVRATLGRARELGVISEPSALGLLAAGKQLFYPARCWPAIFDAAASTVDRSQVEGLARWLHDENAVDQKRLDALELLDEIRGLDSLSVPSPPRFSFEYTEAWHTLRSDIDRRSR